MHKHFDFSFFADTDVNHWPCFMTKVSAGAADNTKSMFEHFYSTSTAMYPSGLWFVSQVAESTE